MEQPEKMEDLRLHIETPVLYSYPISASTGYNVYLKLDNLQPPGSFKIRGISHMIQKAIRAGKCQYVVCASGGNAGMAAAYTSKQLGVPCTIVLPTTTPGFVADKLCSLGAEVKVHGDVYDVAKQMALDLASKPGGLYVPAFDHPDLWEGHASVIEEASRQLPCRPDVVVTCVGGGGLLNGIVQGMRTVGWQGIPVVALETQGAHAFRAAIEAGKIVPLPAITSIAKSLGSLTVSEASLKYYKEAKPEIISQVITDKDAVNGCVKFSEDHRILVEPACGASLSALYSNVLKKLQQEGKLGSNVQTVLVEVCGGGNISTDILETWKKEFGV